MATIEECKKDPSKLDQNSGCCGFAAALMHLFVTQSSALNDFLNCVISCKAYRQIAKSTRITNRLIKRDLAGILDIDAHEDWMLCIALMLLFKESSKQKADGDWKKCSDYSTLWSWSYNDITTDSAQEPQVKKVKEVLAANAKVDANFAQDLSYKGGDLAVPADVLPKLLKLVDIDAIVRETVATKDFKLFAGKKAAQMKNGFTQLEQEIRSVQTTGSTKAVKWSGLILGLGNKPGSAKFEAYDNVTHWVYVPARPNAVPANGEFKIWSWGKEFDFWKEIVDGKKYYPALVIELAQ